MPSSLRAAVGHQRGDRLRVDGAAEIVPLTELTAVPRQERELLLELDPFGHRIERQSMRDRKNGAANRLSVIARIEIRDKRAIDLQHVERKAPQITQARVTGAE